jgi:hypothetical protein
VRCSCTSLGNVHPSYITESAAPTNKRNGDAGSDAHNVSAATQPWTCRRCATPALIGCPIITGRNVSERGTATGRGLPHSTPLGPVRQCLRSGSFSGHASRSSAVLDRTLSSTGDYAVGRSCSEVTHFAGTRARGLTVGRVNIVRVRGRSGRSDSRHQAVSEKDRRLNTASLGGGGLVVVVGLRDCRSWGFGRRER